MSTASSRDHGGTHVRTIILSRSRGPETLFAADDFADSSRHRMMVDKPSVCQNCGSENVFWIRDLNGKLDRTKSAMLRCALLDGIFTTAQKALPTCTEWSNANHADVTFQFKDGRLVQVLVRGSDRKNASYFFEQWK